MLDQGSPGQQQYIAYIAEMGERARREWDALDLARTGLLDGNEAAWHACMSR